MGSRILRVLCALVAAGTASSASAAPVEAALCLNSVLGSFRSAAAAAPAGMPALAGTLPLSLPFAAPPYAPAVFLAASAAPSLPASPAMAGLDGISGKLLDDASLGAQGGRALSDGFFDAARAGADFTAPSASGLPSPQVPADYQPLPITVQETSYSCGVADVGGEVVVE